MPEETQVVSAMRQASSSMRSMSNLHAGRTVLLIIATAATLVGAFPSRALADDSETGGTAVSGETDVYPAQLSLRPLTLFQGMAETSLSGGYVWIEDEPNIAAVSFGARVGITDWWDVSSFTFFRLAPDAEWRDVVGLSTKVLAYNSSRVDFAPGVTVPVNFDQADDTHLFPGIVLDATARIFAAKWQSGSLSRVVSVSCGEGLLPLGVGRRASLNLNCSVVGQGKPNFGFRISGELLHIRLGGDVRESSFLSTLPAVTYFHSIGNWVDLSATYRFAGDAFELSGGISIRK